MTTPNDSVVCFRPVGPAEFALLQANGFTRWPPRLPDQPIFYPVTNERYAIELTQWNVADYGMGYVTRFNVQRSFMDPYAVECVGAAHQTEWWIPAEDLEAMNDHIAGPIEIVGTFPETGA